MRKTFFILSLTASFATTCLAQGSHSPKGNTTAKEGDTTSLMMHDLLTPARYQPHVSGSALNNLQAIQDQRGVVNYYWQKDNPTPKDLDTASAMLHDLLAFQDSSLSYVTEAYSTHLIYKKPLLSDKNNEGVAEAAPFS